jgi:hypothetical protein
MQNAKITAANARVWEIARFKASILTATVIEFIQEEQIVSVATSGDILPDPDENTFWILKGKIEGACTLRTSKVNSSEAEFNTAITGGIELQDWTLLHKITGGAGFKCALSGYKVGIEEL